MNRYIKVSLVVFAGIAVVLWLGVIHPHRLMAAKRELTKMVPDIRAITLYDVDGFGPRDDKELSGVCFAPFPPDLFARAAGSAECKGDPTIWKGSSLAIITLGDGTSRRARFSYYGGFFTLQGRAGRFGVPGGSDSEFHKCLLRVIQGQFVPQRFKRQHSDQA